MVHAERARRYICRADTMVQHAQHAQPAKLDQAEQADDILTELAGHGAHRGANTLFAGEMSGELMLSGGYKAGLHPSVHGAPSTDRPYGRGGKMPCSAMKQFTVT